MDEQFRKLYQQQYLMYRLSQAILARRIFRTQVNAKLEANADTSLVVTDRAVATVARKLGLHGRLRSDGRLFLVMSLHQMVTLPLSHPDSPTKLTQRHAKELTDDVEQILTAASGHARDDEISAAAIVKGTADVLDKLHLKNWRLWSHSNG